MADLCSRRIAALFLTIVMVLAAGALAQPQRPPGRPAGRLTDEQIAARAKQLFDRLDKNKDGKLTKDEFPERVRRLFGRIDANHDGAIELKEDIAFRTQRLRRPVRRRAPLPEPTHANLTYGPHERNVLDLWLARSEAPVPLVIYYHGGGFRAGDKRSLNPALLQKLLDRGVSVAAANYRLSNVAPFPAQMHDSAYALQWLRYHAKKYNLDPKRVGATGGSAGSGISQWLAFHDDLADPKSDDPVKRQSTRIQVAVVYAAQTTYDPRAIQKLFDTDKVDPALIPFFGMKSAEDVKDPKFHPLFEESAPINHATKDDPPILLFYGQANKPLPKNSTGRQHIHHPKFGLTLKAKLDKLGVECVVLLREDHPGGTPVDKYVAFFCKHLGVKNKPEE